MDPESGGWGREGQCNLQMAIGFLRNTSTDIREKQLDPLCPIASRWKSVQRPL